MHSSTNNEIHTIFFTKFKSFLEKTTSTIVITSHKQADPDALGSAILLSYICTAISNARIEIVIPTMSKQSEKILLDCGFDTMVKKEPLTTYQPETCTIILVDTNQPNITDLALIFNTSDPLESWKRCSNRIILDHHLSSPGTEIGTNNELLDNSYNSASELTFNLLKISGIAFPPKNILIINLVGILYDTKRLVLADVKVLTHTAEILTAIGGTIEDYLPYLDNEKDYSERTANLKAGQRNKLVVLQEKYLLSLSFVSSFESSAARALQFLGSDIAAVVNRGKQEVRISFRSTKKFFLETNIHCGVLANYIAEKYSGTGSGHPTAAGCNLPTQNTNNELFESIIRYITNFLENSSKSIID